MKIELNIPANDYTKPTEIREKVVRDIALALLPGIKECTFKINSYNRGVYLSYGKIRLERLYENDIRVHGAEMNAAFKALHQAGYYLYATYCITDDVHTYVWSKKPMYGNQKPMKEPKFTTFID